MGLFDWLLGGGRRQREQFADVINERLRERKRSVRLSVDPEGVIRASVGGELDLEPLFERWRRGDADQAHVVLATVVAVEKAAGEKPKEKRTRAEAQPDSAVAGSAQVAAATTAVPVTTAARVPCTRCGAMVLPETAARFRGECAPCGMGGSPRKPRDSVPFSVWDAAANDLGGDLDRDGATLPRAAVTAWLRALGGGVRLESDDEVVTVEELYDAFDESHRWLVLDWRMHPAEALPIVKKQLAALGHALRFSLVDDESAATLSGTHERSVSFPNGDEQDHEALIESVHAVVDGARYRLARWSIGSDTRMFFLARTDAWDAAATAFPRFTAAMFVAPSQPSGA